MKNNVASWDRIARVILSLILAVLYFTGVVSGTPGIMLLVLAGIFTLTAVVGFCPIYALIHTSTFKPKEQLKA